ncbi:DUF5820 family protein [Salinibaculum rarum]|uniref:DUF5820 family protein n=1 Tax=Salinibaculum rarum TaxID=3058903 RepID=UPI00265E4CF2|nr:DUF5820 family protein [Salinibaculum sp. KK48]
MALDGLADGWDVWSDEQTKVVVAYRPDVFNTTDFPAACLPTIYLTKGKQSRRPGRDRPSSDDAWYVTLYLEPEIDAGKESFDSKPAAHDYVADVSRQFADGEIDYRDLYQVPRPDYLEKLDELTGE